LEEAGDLAVGETPLDVLSLDHELDKLAEFDRGKLES